MVFRCLYSSPEKPGQIVPPFLRCKCSFAPDLPFAQRFLVQRGTTYDRLECTANHQIYPLIGEKIVGDITAADLKSVLNHWMEQGYAYTTVKKVQDRKSVV